MTISICGTKNGEPCFCCWKAVRWIPVLIIIFVVAWTYYAYVIQLCLNLVQNTICQIFYLLFYHLFFFMFCWSYAQSVLTKIGRVPDKFKIADDDFEAYKHHTGSLESQNRILANCAQNLPITNVTIEGNVRFCEKCKVFMPDRTHHCSVCQECILKMDHHCPWINNCVCFTNYKFFILLLGYASFYFIYISLTSLPYFIATWKEVLPATDRFHILKLFLAAIILSIFFTPLFGYHCYLVLKNRSTLEGLRPPRFRDVGADIYGFHLGKIRNFIEVFGKDKKAWFLPVSTSLGDGTQYILSKHLQNNYHFKTNRHSNISDFYTNQNC